MSWTTTACRWSSSRTGRDAGAPAAYYGRVLAMVKIFRRALLALCGAGLLAGAVRLRAATPPARHGGWRELAGPDLR